jgi:dethiobiotin synthase
MPMPSGLFITGTDTSVGKTVVSAVVLRRYRYAACLRYWKPIQTGIEQDDDTVEVVRLAAAEPEEVIADGVRLRGRVSPHLAAQMSGRLIALEPLVRVHARRHPTSSWIVEGAGGVLVPINDRETMADLMLQLALPVLVVARTALGTINHTLMTLETLRNRAIEVAGVVMVGQPNSDARAAIETYGAVAVLAEMPLFQPLNPGALAAWSSEFDRRCHLLAYLR